METCLGSCRGKGEGWNEDVEAGDAKREGMGEALPEVHLSRGEEQKEKELSQRGEETGGVKTKGSRSKGDGSAAKYENRRSRDNLGRESLTQLPVLLK